MGQKCLKSDLAMCSPFLGFTLHNQEENKIHLAFFPFIAFMAVYALHVFEINVYHLYSYDNPYRHM